MHSVIYPVLYKVFRLVFFFNPTLPCSILTQLIIPKDLQENLAPCLQPPIILNSMFGGFQKQGDQHLAGDVVTNLWEVSLPCVASQKDWQRSKQKKPNANSEKLVQLILHNIGLFPKHEDINMKNVHRANFNSQFPHSLFPCRAIYNQLTDISHETSSSLLKVLWQHPGHNSGHQIRHVWEEIWTEDWQRSIRGPPDASTASGHRSGRETPQCETDKENNLKSSQSAHKYGCSSRCSLRLSTA